MVRDLGPRRVRNPITPRSIGKARSFLFGPRRRIDAGTARSLPFPPTRLVVLPWPWDDDVVSFGRLMHAHVLASLGRTIGPSVISHTDELGAIEVAKLAVTVPITDALLADMED